MVKKILSLITIFGFSVTLAFAEGGAFAYNGKTGDKALDLDLEHLNMSALADKDNFIKQFSASYNTSEEKIRGFMERDKMNPADIFMSFEISRLSKKDVDDVVNEYKNNQGQGWGNVAKKMGIKPGSPEFHELKGKAKEKKHKMNKGQGKDKPRGKGKKGNKGKKDREDREDRE